MKFNFKKGFTILELLVVIAIIGVIASITMAAVSSSRNKAKDSSIKTILNQALKVAELYNTNNGRYGYSAGSGVVYICSASSNGDTLFNTDLLPIYAELAKNINGSSGFTNLNDARCHYGPTLNQDITKWAIAVKAASSGRFFCIDNTTNAIKEYTSNTSPAATILAGASGTGVITSTGVECN